MKVNAENTKSDNGNTVTYTEYGDKVTENSYPRNIIFNNYFNQHSVSFIYDDSDEYESNFVRTLAEAYGEDRENFGIEDVELNIYKDTKNIH